MKLRWENIAFILLLLSCCIGQAYSQANFMKLYEQDEIRTLQQQLKKNPPGENNFFQAIFTKNAARAISQMRKIVAADRKTPLLPAVIERIALYQFASGLYKTSQSTFNYLAEKYKNTRYGECGLFYVARSFQAIGKTDSSHLVLEKLLRQYPHSKYSKIASRELRNSIATASPEKEKTEPVKTVTTVNSIGEYTIQTGAFSSTSHAKIQKHFLENKGYSVAIYQKLVGKRRFYVVCLGKFKKKEKAESYGRSIARKYHLDYRIVDINRLTPNR